MGKAILAAIVGYITMAVIVFVALSVVWAALGPGSAFEPGSWDTSMKWNLINPLVGIVAAIAGGYVCALISPGGQSLSILVGIVVVLGALSAVAGMMAPAPTEPRPETIAMFEAMGNARPPMWSLWLNPILGVVGSIIGSRLRGQPTKAGESG